MRKIFLSIVIIVSFAFVIAFTGSGDYSIVNKSGVKVTNISIAKSGDSFVNASNYSQSISDNQTVSISFDRGSNNEQTCSYDVKFTDDRGQSYIMEGIDLCGSDIIVLQTGTVKADEVPQIINPQTK